MFSNLPCRTTRESQHKHDEQTEKTHHKPDKIIQHHQGEPQGRKIQPLPAEMGAVIPETGELTTQTSRKGCLESPTLASDSLQGTDSSLFVVDDSTGFPDGASKKRIANHQRESVPLVSSCIEAVCHSAADNISGFSSDKIHIFESMICLCGALFCEHMSSVNQERENNAGWSLLGQWESCNYCS